MPKKAIVKSKKVSLTPKIEAKIKPKVKAVKKSKAKIVPSVLLVGQKPTMNYVLYTINQMKDAKVIVIKARGKSIHKAVDITEILRRRFLTNLVVKDIAIGTQEVDDARTNQKRRISTIEITIKV